MRTLILLIFFPFCCWSQLKIGLDDNLTATHSASSVSKLNLNFVGSNFVIIKRTEISTATNYSLTFSPKISQNELSQKLNVGFIDSNLIIFSTYQFNHSLLRKLQSDNWIGIGAGFKKNYKFIKSSISYAFIYQNSVFFDRTNTEVFRHSIRGKLKYEKNKLLISTEYYYQPSVKSFDDYIIYGTSKISLKSNKHVNFIIQDVFNFSSKSAVRLIHNITLGIGYTFCNYTEK